MENLETIINFLTKLKLEVKIFDRYVEPPKDSFLENIWIDQGVLWITHSADPGNILHEAGHIATMPSIFRQHATGDLSSLEPIIEAWFDRNPLMLVDGSENLIARAYLESGEQAAIAWSYAAAIACNVTDIAKLYEPHFEGDGKGVYIALKHSTHPGISNLYHAGMIASKRTFPAMKCWLQV